MLIGNKWKIEADNINVILSQKRIRINKQTHKSYTDWRVMGYFATVANALHELINQRVRDTELKDLKTITAKIEKLHIMIEVACNDVRAITEVSKVNS